MVTTPSEPASPSSSSLSTTWPKLEAQFLGRLYAFDPHNSIPRINEDYSWITPDSFMSWYTLVYEYCIAFRPGAPSHTIGGGELYEALITFLSHYLPKVRAYLASLEETGLTNTYLQLWRGWKVAAARVESVFNYLDRFWIDREMQGGRKVLHLIPLLYSLWDELVLIPVEGRLLAWASKVLSMERSSSPSMTIAPSKMIKELFVSYQDLSSLPQECLLKSLHSKPDHYKNVYEQRLVPWYCDALHRDSGVFWDSLISQDDMEVLQRVKQVKLYWEGELGRSSVYLEDGAQRLSNWAKKVKDTLKANLLIPVAPQASACLATAFAGDADPSGPLQICVQTVGLRKSLLTNIWPAVEAGFLMRLRAKLPSKMPETARSEQLLMFISMLFAMFQEGRKIVEDAGLHGETMAINALDSALKTFLTDPAAKASFYPVLGEYLARWIDRIYRDQQPLSPPVFQFILAVLRSVEERQSFQTSYSRLLSRRLLARQAFFERDKEDELLKELASTYGSAFVASLRRMLVDVENSLSLTQQYMTRNQKRPKLPFDLSFQVLSSSCWPAPSVGGTDYIDCQPTAWSRWTGQLGECIDSFSRFYCTHHAPGSKGGGRRLVRWSASLTAAEVVASFGDRAYCFILTVPQLAIIQICSKQPQSLAALTELTGFSPLLLNEALGRLSQIQLVHQHGDAFSLNTAFTSAHSRINLLSGGVLEDRIGPNTFNTRDSSEDRTMVMQAAIIRYLKRTTSCERGALGGHVGINDLEELDRLLKLLSDKEYLAITEYERGNIDMILCLQLSTPPLPLALGNRVTPLTPRREKGQIYGQQRRGIDLYDSHLNESFSESDSFQDPSSLSEYDSLIAEEDYSVDGTE